jgi:inorganic pyrophosphatase
MTHKSLQEIKDVRNDLLDQIEHFFVSYNEPKGKVFKPKGRSGRERATALVAEGKANAEGIAKRKKECADAEARFTPSDQG